ncbi:MAG: histidine kinase [Saprospiraceae bacterium]|nr:histidine kinase [Saprospiraceae bacterium]
MIGWFSNGTKRIGKVRIYSPNSSFSNLQINPHFLFNTLNSPYALTLKKSDLAPEIVLKLSG